MTRGRRLAWLSLALLALNGLAAAGFTGLGLTGGAACAGLGLVAYLLGVRHAFDADHIAAIDNVTRRMRQQGHRPVAIGFFFSLGHSAVVMGMTLALVLASRHLQGMSPWLVEWGAPVSFLASAAFLTVIGWINLRPLVLNRGNGGQTPTPPAGTLGRISHSRAMFPLGLLFGLNLDTAGEILLLAASATAIPAVVLPWWAVMAFPLLFTAGMAVADSFEGLLMLRLYDWAIADRDRTLRLNAATTAISAVLALSVAAVQWSALAQWAGVSSGITMPLMHLNGAAVGAGITAGMAALWAVARLRRRATVAAAPQVGVISG